MANTFSQIYIHLVFAVKYREAVISEIWEEELHKYICGIVREKNQKVFAINGVPDHIHILLSIRPDCQLSNLVRDIKANSSKFINDKQWIRGRFQWQEGYGAFSCSHGLLDTVIGYIEKQKEHHKNIVFKDEYIALLKEFNINYNEQFLFEWI